MNKKLFGTDGVRGVANIDITPAFALKFATAISAKMLGRYNAKRVVIGKDTRISCYMIEAALAAGFTSMGIDVLFLGVIPTPAVSVLVKSLRADFGIMISASHNKHVDNGIKIFDKKGDKISAETEEDIENFFNTKKLYENFLSPERIGKSYRIDGAAERYIENIKSYFYKDSLNLHNLKIIVDAANGAAYKIAEKIFWELGAEVTMLANTPNGLNINENCGSTNPAKLAEAVILNKADIGLAFDGDADRLVIVTETGEILDGDHLLGAIAYDLYKNQELKNNLFVTTIISNLALDNFLKQYGINTIRSNVGDKYVSKALQENGAIFGGEKSGHILFTNHSSTGDALIAALRILNMMIKSEKKASEILKLFDLYPEISKNLEYNSKIEGFLNSGKINILIHEAKNILGEGDIIIRKSGTEKLLRLNIQGADVTKLNDSFNFILVMTGIFPA